MAANKRYAGAEGWTVSEVAAKVAKDVGKIDILVHSLANGPEVKVRTRRRCAVHAARDLRAVRAARAADAPLGRGHHCESQGARAWQAGQLRGRAFCGPAAAAWWAPASPPGRPLVYGQFPNP